MADDEIEDEHENGGDDEPSEPDIDEEFDSSLGDDEDLLDDDDELDDGDSSKDDGDSSKDDGDSSDDDDEDGDDDEDVDVEEELHPDDIEEPLDVLLLERTSSGLMDEDDYDEEDDDADGDDRAEPGARIPRRRPGEFVCRSCFLVKHPSQLADLERNLCSDCV